MIHEKNVNQLKSEVQYIQEVWTLSLEGTPRFPEPYVLGFPFMGSGIFFCSFYVTEMPMASYVSNSIYLSISICYLFFETGSPNGTLAALELCADQFLPLFPKCCQIALLTFGI